MILYTCSTNPGKLREFALAAQQVREDLTILPLPALKDVEPPEETGATFEENAAIKALYYSRLTDEMVFADDSGLVVDALGGEPGVYSARYAGPNATDEANNSLLLQNVAGHVNRHARFVCAIVAAKQGQLLHSVTGTVEGEILEQPVGPNGFGYDPLFFYPPLNRGFGELSPDAKFAVSHRGHAVRALLGWLRDQR